jgi:hypothetical protein
LLLSVVKFTLLILLVIIIKQTGEKYIRKRVVFAKAALLQRIRAAENPEGKYTERKKITRLSYFVRIIFHNNGKLMQQVRNISRNMLKPLTRVDRANGTFDKPRICVFLLATALKSGEADLSSYHVYTSQNIFMIMRHICICIRVINIHITI